MEISTDSLMRVLEDRRMDLVALLTEDAALSPDQAEDFLRAAGPALIESYRRQASARGIGPLSAPETARDLLAGIHGRGLAAACGLSSERAWRGLRALVPAVLSAAPPPVEPSDRLDIGFGLSVDRRLLGDRGWLQPFGFSGRAGGASAGPMIDA